MKKKGVIMYGGGQRLMCNRSPNVSGHGPGGLWVSQLPFMQKDGPKAGNVHYSSTGFSINGGHRSGTYIGKSSAFSTVSTPFRGTNARGYGGTQGTYPISAFIQGTASDVAGIQQAYIKPSTVSTKCMLAKKLIWIYHSQYPNVWVQPTYPSGPLDGNASMGSYIQKIKSQNCTNMGNDTTPICTECTSVKLTKTVKSSALSYSQYLDYLDRKCLNPKGIQKPFPFNQNNNRKSLNQSIPLEEPRIYYKPPAWYINKC